MRKAIYILIFMLGIAACSSSDDLKKNEYEFINEYSAIVTVGGIIGVIERKFEIGEVYTGTDKGSGLIKIRIAEPSERNNDCPNSWCYQEFLEVPKEYLNIVE